MNNYIIRLAKTEDIKTIQQLSQELIDYEKNKTNKKYMLNMNWVLTEFGYNYYKLNIEHDWIYVACSDDTIIGYMTCWINKRKPWFKYDVLEIGNLYIKKEYRGLGIGTQLVNKAKKICKEKEIKFLKIGVL